VSRPSASTSAGQPSSHSVGPALPLPAVAIVGLASCGKTELICKLLALAQERGLRVAALKHSHKNLQVDQPGKDTWRFRQAGARAVALAAPGLLQVTHFPAADPPAAEVLAALPADVDFVLVEGYKTGPMPKIVFVPPGNPGAELPKFTNSIAYICDRALNTALPVFCRDQAGEILDFILQWLQG
jgi:molybdopterin-guanine dinucleotide biosynthesis adapter protein